MKYHPIPVAAAESLAATHGKETVIILAYDRREKRTDVVTWGDAACAKETARRQGEACARVIGCELDDVNVYEDFHADFNPAVQKEALDILTQLRGNQKLPDQPAAALGGCHPGEKVMAREVIDLIELRLAMQAHCMALRTVISYLSEGRVDLAVPRLEGAVTALEATARSQAATLELNCSRCRTSSTVPAWVDAGGKCPCCKA